MLLVLQFYVDSIFNHHTMCIGKVEFFTSISPFGPIGWVGGGGGGLGAGLCLVCVWSCMFN